MERATVEIYEERGLEWAASHATAGRRAEAESFAARVGAGGVRLDVGCGAGRYLPHLGTPVIALDASAVHARRPAAHGCPTLPTSGPTSSTSRSPATRSAVRGRG